MADTLARSRANFSAEVRRRVRRDETDAIAAQLDTVVEWSSEPRRQLQVREPGLQSTVSFGLAESDLVLWAAYPRNNGGAKIEVLPRTFRRLPANDQQDLLKQMRDAAPTNAIVGTGLLSTPLPDVRGDRGMKSLLDLLASAWELAAEYRRAET